MKKHLTQSDFADLCGINKSSVSRAVSNGRIELTKGAIEVEVENDTQASIEIAALELWINTASSRPHHQARLAQLQEQREARKQMMSGEPEEAQEDSDETLKAYNLRIKRADAKKREEDARTAEINRLALEKKYLMTEAVAYGIRDYTATVNRELENLADRLAASLKPLETVEEIHTAIARESENIRATVHKAMMRAIKTAEAE